jgi:hypothetical protein
LVDDALLPEVKRVSWVMRVALVLLAGCGFQHGALGGSGSNGDAAVDDADASSADASPDSGGGTNTSFVALHVPAASSAAGSAGLTLTTSTTIDTDALTVGGSITTSGVVFDHVAQSPSGPQLAVLHVSTLLVNTAVVVRVTGSRPLVVIASGAITIVGRLDASGRNALPGAGGGFPATGDRPGAQGAHNMTYCDAGGGGAGHATGGGIGGNVSGTGSVSGETCAASGGTPGGIAGDAPITVLAGGSGGGPGRGGAAGNVAQCVAAGGAGGGAIQLSSATSITIEGDINVGGGGGTGGVGDDTTNCTNRGSGGGGGSAGSIVLQSPSITVAAGAGLVAHGGGGGGGAAVGVNGGDGGDGGAAAGTAGTSGGNYGAIGGAGGASSAPGNGGSNTGGDGNGAGGGGAAGRIAVFRSASGTATLVGTISPAPFSGTY